MFIFGAPPLYALDSEEDNLLPHRRLWKMSDKLPAGSVLAIASTADGYLWFGTQKGLLRFDGMNYRLFDDGNTPELKNNIVQALLPTANGELWIGTAGGGAVRLKGGKFTGFSSENGLADDFVQAFCETPNGTIFIATGKGLNRFDQNQNALETIEELRGKTVNSLALDVDGNLWIGTYGDGLYRLADNQTMNFTAKDGLIGDYVWSLGIDARRHLWIGTRDGISRFDGTRFENFTELASGYKQSVYAILPQTGGEILFGTETAGIVRFDGAKWSADTEDNGLPSNGVYALATDREENVWAGTLGGAARLARHAFTMLTAAENLRGSITSAVYQDRRGNLWIGTDKGLNLYRSGKFVTSAEEKIVGQRPVYAIVEDASGRLLIGTKGGGLFVFDNGRTLNFNEKTGLAGDIVFSVLPARTGKIWIGTYGGGLCELVGDKINCLREKDGLLSDFVSFLMEDRDANLWIVGKQGISRLADGAFTNFPNSQNGLPNAEVYAVYQTSDGSIWAGTDGGGLCLFQNGEWRGLPHRRDNGVANSIFNLLEDEQGFVWLAGSQGISRVGLAELKQAAADGDAGKLNALSFDAGDGLETANFVGGAQSTARRDQNGRLWFGTIRGAATVNPAQLKINKTAPPVKIENLKINDTDVGFDENLTLAPNAARLSLEYAALSFAAPEKVRFRYKLEGFDRDWIEAGAERAARYTNLPPGDYTFRVSAAQNGVWNETGASVKFKKQPFFYQTWWFYALSAAAIIIAGIGFYQWRARRRLRQINEKHRLVLRERTRLAREIHDTLTQGLTGVSAQLQAAQIAHAKGLNARRDNHLKIAGELTGENLNEARQWIRILSDSAPDSDYLADALHSFARKIERRSAIRLNCRIENALPALSAETTENILRIAQEAVNNAVKHAAARLVEIELRRRLHDLTLYIIDDGCGFEPEKMSSNGFGQRSMRERAAAIGAQISIESRKGNGTSVRLIIPLTEQNLNGDG